MVSIPGVDPIFLWSGFILLVLFLLWLDLGVFHRTTRAVSVQEALLWAGIWFGISMAFNAIVWLEFGHEIGLQFFTGYLIEKSLSMDNLFVILLIFTSFHIPAKFQHRVLFWGILGAIIMRGLLIGIGATLTMHFHWIFYLFGAFLVWTGIRFFFETEETFDPHSNLVVRIARKILPVSKKDNGERFFTKENGKRMVTILFIALIVIEFTDVLFAFDSIPAIFAITNDPFIVFTSNIFAILGLRSLYFVIARAHDLFSHLKIGLAIVLVFIGTKLLIKDWYEIPIIISLIIVLLILSASIGYSIWETKHEKQKN